MIGRAVRRPREVEIEVDRRTGIVLTLGVDVGRVGHGRAGHVGGETELLEWSAQLDLDTPAAAAVDGGLRDQGVARWHGGPVVDGADAGGSGADDPGCPPGDLAVGVEPETQPAGQCAVVGDEVAVVRLVPQVLPVWDVTALVRGQDGVRRPHRRGPGCIALAPSGPDTSTTGSSRSSNSVRRALDITAC